MNHWKIIYTQNRFEFKVEHQLKQLGIEHYLPTRKVLRKWSDRNKWLVVPSFPSYLFVRPDESLRNHVFYARGVLCYLRTGNRDAMIRDDEIQMIKKAENFIEDTSLQPLKLNKGQVVKIVMGPLAGHHGRLVEFNGKRKIQLALEDIEMGFLVEIPTYQLQAM